MKTWKWGREEVEHGVMSTCRIELGGDNFGTCLWDGIAVRWGRRGRGLKGCGGTDGREGSAALFQLPMPQAKGNHEPT